MNATCFQEISRPKTSARIRIIDWLRNATEGVSEFLATRRFEHFPIPDII